MNHRAHISRANLQLKHTTRPHQLLREKAFCAAAGTTTGTIGDYIIVPPDSSEVYGIASTQSGIAGVNVDAHTAHESCSDGSAQVRKQTAGPSLFRNFLCERMHSGYFPRQARDRHKERTVKGGGRLCLRTGHHCPTRRPASAAGWIRWTLRGQSLQVHQVRNAIWITNSPYKLTICQDRLGTNKRKTQQKIAFRIARMSMTTAVRSR